MQISSAAQPRFATKNVAARCREPARKPARQARAHEPIPDTAKAARQPRAPAPQPGPQDRPQAPARSAARVGNAAAGIAARREGRAAVRPGRGFHHDRHDRLHRACGGARPSGWKAATPAEASCTSSGSSARSTALSTAKDDSYRSPRWEPGLPVDLPTFLDELLTRQIQDHPHQQCACAGQHGGTGLYVFLGPDGRHYRRSNYARRVFRPACDGRHKATPSRPARVIIADVTAWQGIPVAAWPAAQPGISPAAKAQMRTPADTAPGAPTVD